MKHHLFWRNKRFREGTFDAATQPPDVTVLGHAMMSDLQTTRVNVDIERQRS